MAQFKHFAILSPNSPTLKIYSYFSRLESRFTTFGDQGFFVRRSDYKAIGGCASIPLFEDIDLRQRLKAKGAIKKAPLYITTSAERFIRKGVIKTQLLNMFYIAAYELGMCPKKLAKKYYASKSATSNHAVDTGEGQTTL